MPRPAQSCGTIPPPGGASPASVWAALPETWSTALRHLMLDSCWTRAWKLSKITNLWMISPWLWCLRCADRPIPDKISVVGIEVPNKQVTPVLIRDDRVPGVLQSTSPKWLPWKGYRRPEHRGEISSVCPRADRRHHRIRQVRVHQLPDCRCCCTSPPRMRSALSWWILQMSWPLQRHSHLLIPVVTDPKRPLVPPMGGVRDDEAVQDLLSMV